MSPPRHPQDQQIHPPTSHPTRSPPENTELPSQDPFDTLLTLESQFHSEGYQLGYADGSAAGRIEGRVFGLEKGFDKFSEMGRLGGQAAVWEARLRSAADSGGKEVGERQGGEGRGKGELKGLKGGERLAKHIRRLRELTDPEAVPTANSEEAVQNFDDQLKDAKAKTTLISKIVGERGSSEESGRGGEMMAGKGVRVKREEGAKAGKEGEMEDFGGMRGVGSK